MLVINLTKLNRLETGLHYRYFNVVSTYVRSNKNNYIYWPFELIGFRQEIEITHQIGVFFF